MFVRVAQAHRYAKFPPQKLHRVTLSFYRRIQCKDGAKIVTYFKYVLSFALILLSFGLIYYTRVQTIRKRLIYCTALGFVVAPPPRLTGRSVNICIHIYLLIYSVDVRYVGNELGRFRSASPFVVVPYSADERPVTLNGLYIIQVVGLTQCLADEDTSSLRQYASGKWHPGHECYAPQQQSRATRLWYLCYNIFHCTLVYID